MDLSSTIIVLNLIFGYFVLEKLIDLINELKDFKELYDSGVLTEEEFNKAKKKLLD